MAREFADVFEPVTGLPPKRSIEFQIDLVPGAELGSRKPSRMKPTEMKNLMVHLVDLEGKNFIRPSSSPWGVAWVFVKKSDGSLKLCIDYTAS